MLGDTALSATQQAYVDGIRTSGDALLTVINDILDSSKIEAGMLQIESIDFELHSAIANTLQIFAEPARRKQLALAVVIEDDVPAAVCGDPNRLRQVLTNLIGNVVKFTSAGSVRLHVSSMPRRGDVSTIRFAIRDTGIGLAPDVLGRVFQPLVQADSSTTRHFGGTGLGLAISKRLVELMGGVIDVESQPGLGSTFWFAVPLPEAAAGVPIDMPTLSSHASVYGASSLPVWSDPVPLLKPSPRGRGHWGVDPGRRRQHGQPGRGSGTRSRASDIASTLPATGWRHSTPSIAAEMPRSRWTARCRAWTASPQPPRSGGAKAAAPAHPDHRPDRLRHRR